jgi:hypothetical protein
VYVKIVVTVIVLEVVFIEDPKVVKLLFVFTIGLLLFITVLDGGVPV